MRTEFNNLVELMNRYDLYQKDDEVGIALSELEQKITEVEKRIECARRSNQDSNSVIMSLVTSYQDLGKTKEELTYGDFETLQRGVYDVDIALNFNDKEPIENNWYQLFEEPKQEEPKIIYPKGTILEWTEKINYYSANGGARARVTEDYTTKCETVKVEWIDKKSNGQENGGYLSYMFKDEPITELSSGGIPYRYCYECSIKEEETVMNKVNGFFVCNDCDPTPPTDLCRDKDKHEIVKDIIAKLKNIEVDGETMQYILEQVGMDDQMLKQLARKDPKETMEIIAE